MEETLIITARRGDKLLVINKNCRYQIGIINICGNKYQVEGDKHLFVDKGDAIECLLSKVLTETV